jgi:hypothetical protein
MDLALVSVRFMTNSAMTPSGTERKYGRTDNEYTRMAVAQSMRLRVPPKSPPSVLLLNFLISITRGIVD